LSEPFREAVRPPALFRGAAPAAVADVAATGRGGGRAEEAAAAAAAADLSRTSWRARQASPHACSTFRFFVVVKCHSTVTQNSRRE